MNIKTYKGKEIDLDFKSEKGYENARNLFGFLKDNDALGIDVSDDEAIQSIVDTIKLINAWSEDEILSVTKHYYFLLKEKIEIGEIDETDFLILQGKMVIEELEGRWS